MGTRFDLDLKESLANNFQRLNTSSQNAEKIMLWSVEAPSKDYSRRKFLNLDGWWWLALTICGEHGASRLQFQFDLNRNHEIHE